MKPLLRGFVYLTRKPKLWVYAWGPLIVTGILYLLLLVVAQVSLIPLVDKLTPSSVSMPIIGGVAVFLLWLVAANFFIIAITSLFSGLLWGRLSAYAEQDLFGDAPNARLGCLPQMKDTFLRLIQAGVFVVAVIAFAWLGPIAGAVASGVLVVIEFSAPAYARRGHLYPAQLRVWQLPAAYGFGIGAGLLSLLPFVFVLTMPALVVGATIMCREGEANQTLP